MQSESSPLCVLPSHCWAPLDQCIAEFERDFHAGQARPLREYLPPSDSVLAPAAGIELAKVDLELRFRAGWEPPSEGFFHQLHGLVDTRMLHRELNRHLQRFADPTTAAISLNAMDDHAVRSLQWAALTPRLADQPPQYASSGPPLPAGCRLGDYEIVGLLGEGAFAKVYLAQQRSLNRRVALKVSAIHQGEEAQTLASLEHDHIVRVFSESVDPYSNSRLICMQYVAGATLAAVIAGLHQSRDDEGGNTQQGDWTGDQFVHAVTELSAFPQELRERSLEDRQQLGESDLTQAVCWIGERLADALAYAHSREVFHRDIKPANILVDQYGRPYLADFNLSSVRREPGDSSQPLGGTYAYMSSEHLQAMIRQDPPSSENVDHRCDIFSLGVVLFELANGAHPFPIPSGRPIDRKQLEQIAETRAAGAPSPRRIQGAISPALDRVIRRCLAPDPNDRFQSAAELSVALAAARQMQSIDRALPPAGRITRAALDRPLAMKFLLDFSPHILGAVLNISYILIFIYGTLTDDQKTCYHFLAPVYTLVAFAATAYFAHRLCDSQIRTWRRLRSSEEILPREAADLRKRVRGAPLWGVAVSLAGWLPGALFFPLGLAWLTGEGVSGDLFIHFGAIFLISGFIALTHSFFSAEFFTLRINYPSLLSFSPMPQRTARRELRCVRRRVRWFQILTGAVPLWAALLVILVSPQMAPQRYDAFRLLLAALITLGVLGGAMSVPITNQLMEYLTAMVGVETRPAENRS